MFLVFNLIEMLTGLPSLVAFLSGCKRQIVLLGKLKIRDWNRKWEDIYIKKKKKKTAKREKEIKRDGSVEGEKL
jgi:hypothetical protein